MWPSGLTLALTLTLNFQGQTWNWLYLSQKWSDCHETKCKHIDRTLGLKCDHQVWPWPWPWPRIFKVKHGIGYISAKNGPIAMKRKANISTLIDIWPWPWIFKVKYEICYVSAKSGPKVRCSDLPDSDWGDFKCRRAADSSSWHMGETKDDMVFVY